MSIKELRAKLPLVNSSKKSVRVIGYVLVCFIVLMIIGAMTGSHNPGASTSGNTTTDTSLKCLNRTEMAMSSESEMMQTGVYKSVHIQIPMYANGKFTFDITPSENATKNGNATTYWTPIYAAVRAAHEKSPCVDKDVSTVVITTHSPEYDIVTTYPYSSVITQTEDKDKVNQIQPRGK
jgi:hypothetical protein